MGRKSRAKRERQSKELEHGWMIELATVRDGWPAGRFWFNAEGPTRTPPENARRMAWHTNCGGRLAVSSSRPAVRERS